MESSLLAIESSSLLFLWCCKFASMISHNIQPVMRILSNLLHKVVIKLALGLFVIDLILYLYSFLKS